MFHKYVAIIETILLLILVATLAYYVITHGAPNGSSLVTGNIG